MTAAQSYANPAVLEFYESLPFNMWESAEDEARAIRALDVVASYPVLPPLLGKAIRVIELGCGTGWLSNAIGLHTAVT